MSRLLVALALAMVASAGATEPPLQVGVRFVSEDVTLIVADGILTVDGTYHLHCDDGGPPEILLLYPYPHEDRLGEARTISLEYRGDGGSWQAGTWLELPDNRGARWRVGAATTLTVHTRYTQELRERYARYIVTTTAAWGRPLAHARFCIALPAGARPEAFSFPFVASDTLVTAGTGPCYVYETDDFLPDHDVTVTWRMR